MNCVGVYLDTKWGWVGLMNTPAGDISRVLVPLQAVNVDMADLRDEAVAAVARVFGQRRGGRHQAMLRLRLGRCALAPAVRRHCHGAAPVGTEASRPRRAEVRRPAMVSTS